MIKAVIFDCFGVLTTDTWNLFLESLPDGADAENVRRAHRAYNAGKITKEDCAKQIQAATGGRGFVELDDVVRHDIVKNTLLLDYIHKLHERGLKISILSNIGSNWIRDQLLSTEEQSWIDDFVFSYQVGMVKPDPQMYALACERLAVQPEEVLFVDDKEWYCAAARDLGMQAIRYEDFRQTKTGIEKALAA